MDDAQSLSCLFTYEIFKFARHLQEEENKEEISSLSGKFVDN